MSQSITILTGWRLDGGDTSAMDFLIRFIEKRKKAMAAPPEYAFCLGGRVYSDGVVGEEDLCTETIIFMQKMSYKSFLRRTGLNVWRYRPPSVVYCAVDKHGDMYYFRLSGAATAVRNCMAYMSSGKKRRI